MDYDILIYIVRSDGEDCRPDESEFREGNPRRDKHTGQTRRTRKWSFMYKLLCLVPTLVQTRRYPMVILINCVP
jgi:hypothetical protein